MTETPYYSAPEEAQGSLHTLQWRFKDETSGRSRADERGRGDTAKADKPGRTVKG